jgi:hypothetical protein
MTTPDSPEMETLARIAEDVAAVRETLDEIQQDFGWAVRNLIPQIASMPIDPCDPQWAAKLKMAPRETLAETLTCGTCGCDGDGLAKSFKAGWIDITIDESGFVGTCPGCRAEEEAEELRLNPWLKPPVEAAPSAEVEPPAGQKELF